MNEKEIILHNEFDNKMFDYYFENNIKNKGAVDIAKSLFYRDINNKLLGEENEKLQQQIDKAIELINYYEYKNKVSILNADEIISILKGEE